MDAINPLQAADDFCTLCELNFENRRDFTKHCKNMHSLQCLTCNRKYESQRALDQHYRDSLVHPRCECGQGFADKLSLEAHLEAGHEEDTASKGPSSPEVAEVTHAPSQPSGASHLQCGPCNKSYASEKALKQHYRDSVLHPSCQYCEEAFSAGDVLAHHVVTMHPEEPATENPTVLILEANLKRAHRCDLCNRRYVSEKALVQHYRDSTRHPTCEHCDASFPDLRAREVHVMEVHKAGPGKQNTPVAPRTSVDVRPMTYNDLRTIQSVLGPLLLDKQASSNPDGLQCYVCQGACATVVLCANQHILCEKCVSNATSACSACRSKLLGFSISPT